MSPKQRLAVRQIDSAPLLGDLRNWFAGHVIAAEGAREGVLADFGFPIAQQKTTPFVTTDNIERFPSESPGSFLDGASGGSIGPGFRRDSGPRKVSSRAGRLPAVDN
jgi:hypothetical protein